MVMRLALLVVMVLLVAGSVVAAGPGQCQSKQDQTQIGQDEEQLASTRLSLKRLTHAVDLWHDANLKGDRTAVTKCERALKDLIKTDIDITQAQIARLDREAAQSALQFKHGDRSWSESAENHADYVDDRSDLGEAKQLFGAKKRLANTWSKSDAFSNKYRLVNDYLDVLRRQAGLQRMELAEDIEELDEDR
jgi:hypothetical protein